MQHNTATRRNASPSVLAGAFCLRSDSADARFEEVRGGRPAPPFFFPHNASAESFRHFNGIITLLKHPKTAVAASILSTQSQRRWRFQSVFKAPLLFSFPHKKKKKTQNNALEGILEGIGPSRCDHQPLASFFFCVFFPSTDIFSFLIHLSRILPSESSITLDPTSPPPQFSRLLLHLSQYFSEARRNTNKARGTKDEWRVGLVNLQIR